MERRLAESGRSPLVSSVSLHAERWTLDTSEWDSVRLMRWSLGIGFPAKQPALEIKQSTEAPNTQGKKNGNPGKKTGKHWAGRTNLRRKFSKVRGTPWPPLVKVRECRSQLQDAHAIGSALLRLGGRDAAAHRELSKNPSASKSLRPSGLVQSLSASPGLSVSHWNTPRAG